MLELKLKLESSEFQLIIRFANPSVFRCVSPGLGLLGATGTGTTEIMGMKDQSEVWTQVPSTRAALIVLFYTLDLLFKTFSREQRRKQRGKNVYLLKVKRNFKLLQIDHKWEIPF